MGIRQEQIDVATLDQLSDEELIRCYREECVQAIEVLVQRYKGFVRTKIKSNFFIGADREDLIQEGMIGLFKAINDYNPNLEVSFKSFATLCITRQISTAFKMATRQKHMPLNTSISLNLPVAGHDEDIITLMDTLRDSDQHNPEAMMIHKEALELLKMHMKESLSDFEWRVLLLHTRGRSYHEIAEHMKKPVKSIDNALQRIKKKLSEKVNQK